MTPFVPESLLLTWNPSFLCGAILIHPGPRLLVNWPPPPHSLFPPPNGFPNSIVCLSKTTSRHRLHLVRNTDKHSTLFRKRTTISDRCPALFRKRTTISYGCSTLFIKTIISGRCSTLFRRRTTISDRCSTLFRRRTTISDRCSPHSGRELLSLTDVLPILGFMPSLRPHLCKLV